MEAINVAVYDFQFQAWFGSDHSKQEAEQEYERQIEKMLLTLQK